MSEVLTEAIVLHRTDYRDADRMITLFSPEYGRIDVCARGVRKPASRMKAACEPFATGIFQLHTAGERSTLTGFTLSEGFFPLRNDYDRLTFASYALALCGSVVQPNKRYAELFALLQCALGRFAYTQVDGKNMLLRFLLAFAECEGFAMSLRECVRCGNPVEGSVRFSYDEGGACHYACLPYGARLTDATLALLRRAQTGLDICDEDVAMDSSDALEITRRFIETHLGCKVRASDMILK